MWFGNNHAKWSEAKQNFWDLDMLVWMSSFQNPLTHTNFNMFVDEY